MIASPPPYAPPFFYEESSGSIPRTLFAFESWVVAALMVQQCFIVSSTE